MGDTSDDGSVNGTRSDLVDMSLESEAIRLESCNDVNFRAKAYVWCKTCLGGAWKKCHLEDFKVNYVSGGLTNYLYLCSLPNSITCSDGEPRKVLIRIYGEILDNRAKFYEGVIFTLMSERDYGPQLYGVFHSGRIEEFIDARHLTTRELADPTLSKCLAKKVALYHCMNTPLNKDPTFLWENMEKWLKGMKQISFDTEREREMLKEINSIDLEMEYQNLRNFIESTKSPVVFCHNDLQEGNILLRGVNGKRDVLVIDYEYSSYNYRGFDFGNHFCEWMYDYSHRSAPGFITREDEYPTREQQATFLKAYLAELETIVAQGPDRRMLIRDVTIGTVDELIVEANRFALVSHLFWCLWSVLQTKLSKIEFGFLEYALARFRTYRRQKELFWPQ